MKFFWSWQSDTPGNTGRYFVRDALLEAIKQLKQPEDVEEPTTAAHREAMHLDSDRQGVTGSPPLAATIKKKIKASTVFVGDVTPVSSVPKREGAKEKRSMNVNVAIELGYAMDALNEEHVLLVLNEHYGGRDFLPFHLQDLGGPIAYNLGPNATREDIAAQMPKLRSQFVTAIREFMKAVPASTKFDDQTEYAFTDDKGVYLRVSPRTQLARPFTSAELLSLARQRQIGLLYRTQAGLPHGNTRGAVVIEPVSGSGGRMRAATQIFRSGEIWGVGRDLLVDNDHGKFIPVMRLEEALRSALEGYVKSLGRLGVEPPYDIEFGVTGTNGYSLVIETTLDNPYTIYDDSFTDHLVLQNASPQSIDDLLLRIYESFFRMTGHPRPPHLFDFPSQARSP
jgi:hypothetical protein